MCQMLKRLTAFLFLVCLGPGNGKRIASGVMGVMGWDDEGVGTWDRIAVMIPIFNKFAWMGVGIDCWV